MTDREKIMNDFEHEVNKAHGEGWDFVDLSTDDAKKILVLLKEQEPVKPTPGMLCGQCGCRIYRDANYCYNCGKAVKWNDSDRNGNG